MISDNNLSSIYGTQSNGIIYSPFNFKLEPMERLIIFGIENDPDEIYTTFESQIFDDNIYGKGMRILATRNDGYVDVYYQPGLIFNSNDFNQVGKGLRDLIERPMKNARYEITSEGVDLFCTFEDKTGRQIEIKIKENNKKTPKPFNVLAPLGAGTYKPDALPLFMLYDIDFIRRTGTEIQITIAGREHKVDKIPLLVDGSKIYYIRYSIDPFLVKWNVAGLETLYPLELSGKLQIQDKDTTYDLIDNKGHYEIKQMSIANEKHSLTVYFKPAVPDIVCIHDGASLKGKITIASEKTTGTVSGEYELSRYGSKIKMKVHPNGGWKPNEPKWSMKLLYVAIPMFKNWTKTYIWTAEIELNEKGQPTMNSEWKRKDYR